MSYNDISDLSPLCLLERLEVLDLEGNSVEDLGQVQYLQLCRHLVTLTLEGNLVCLRPAPGPSDKVRLDASGLGGPLLWSFPWPSHGPQTPAPPPCLTRPSLEA